MLTKGVGTESIMVDNSKRSIVNNFHKIGDNRHGKLQQSRINWKPDA